MYCKRCNTEKGEEDFPRNKAKVNGRGSYCNVCNYEKLKEWRKNNPDKVSALQKDYYRRKHGQSATVCQE